MLWIWKLGDFGEGSMEKDEEFALEQGVFECPSGKIPSYLVFERLVLGRARDIPGQPFFGIRFNLMGVA